jgi:hypothetical protein
VAFSGLPLEYVLSAWLSAWLSACSLPPYKGGSSLFSRHLFPRHLYIGVYIASISFHAICLYGFSPSHTLLPPCAISLSTVCRGERDRVRAAFIDD